VAESKRPKRADEGSFAPSSPPPSFASTLGNVDAGAGIEIVVVRERTAARGQGLPWRAFEVWTKNRVYGVDTMLRCTSVLDRRTGHTETAETSASLRLGGGRLRTGGTTRVSYPYPLPGMEAIFTDGKRQVHTSRVERFVIRIREMYTKGDGEPLTWEDIAEGKA
jgi:hypothetical protein